MSFLNSIYIIYYGSVRPDQHKEWSSNHFSLQMIVWCFEENHLALRIIKWMKISTWFFFIVHSLEKVIIECPLLLGPVFIV